MSAEAAAGDHAKSAREGAPPAAVPSRWRSLWARAPKPVLMVLFGALVSAWLVPAFTRQWQDRQKEREIKVGLVSEISDSTSDGLVTSQFVAGGALTNGQAEYNRISLDWARRSAQVESTLAAYFPGQELVDDWHDFSIVVENDFFLLTRNKAGKAEAVNTVRRYLETARGTEPFAAVNWDRLQRLDFENAQAVDDYVLVSRELLEASKPLIQAILDANAAGFSTTGGELVDDLTPFT
jgi:hypothetical protein